jgi:hypothetical protein
MVVSCSVRDASRGASVDLVEVDAPSKLLLTLVLNSRLYGTSTDLFCFVESQADFWLATG